MFRSPPKPGASETSDTESGLSETKSSGSGKESPRLPKTGSSWAETESRSSFNSRSAAMQRRMPRRRMTAIDRRRTDAASHGRSSSKGREARELTSMIVLHRKDLGGSQKTSLPDLSMQFVRRASHYRKEKFAFWNHLERQKNAETVT
jgi:hypothetical protein